MCFDSKDGKDSDLTEAQEREIIERAARGDEAAWAILYARHYRRVFFFCFRILKNSCDAEDAMIETFLKANQSLNPARSTNFGQFGGWIVEIATTTVLEELRRRRARKRTPPPSKIAEDSLGTNRPANPYRQAVINEENEILQKCIERLPLDQRNAAILRYFEDMEYQQIANALGMTYGRVQGLLQRARANLRDCIERSGLR